MPANFCLMPETVQRFKVAIKDGRINPEKMADMSSLERRDFLSGIVGKNHAQAVNSLFESKILLKNQQQGYLTWAKQVSGIKPAARRDLIKKIENMQKVLDPEDGKQFMQDLTATRLGVNISEQEAKNIADLSKLVSEKEALRRPDKTFPTKEQRMEYGRAVEDMTEYVSNLKVNASKLRVSDVTGVVRRGDIAGGGGILLKFTSRLSGNLKSLSASLDNSAVFRQGWKAMWSHPGVWAKNAADTFVTAAKTVGGKNVMREVNADIISRPNYELYNRGGLAVKNAEEAFPESLAEKVPAVGQLYKASQDAFTAFQYKNRADIADKLIDLAKKKGVNVNDKEELKAIMNVVNSLTGRGNLGAFEKNADFVNSVFFSPRFVKSQVDTFTQTLGGGGAKTAFARRQAQKNLAKVVGGTFSLLAAADAVLPGSVEWDPRSSDFGKIRVGDTRFDVSGGISSIITLFARQATNSSKSATTDVVTEYGGDDFGARTRFDAVLDFFTNKTSPGGRIIVDALKGKNFEGEDFNLVNSLVKASTPITAQTFIELQKNPRAANEFMSIIADGLGIGSNTYSAADFSKFEKKTTEEMKQFKESVGEEKFKKADEAFQKEYNEFVDEVRVSNKYKKMSDDDKRKLLAEEKKEIKEKIFTNYNFTSDL